MSWRTFRSRGTPSAYFNPMRDHTLRLAAIGLIVYGLLGLALVAISSVVAWRTFEQLDQIGASIGEQRDALVGSLQATSGTLRSSTTAFDGIDATLGNARTSSTQAARFARDLSTTMGQLAVTAQLNIFGVQPLIGLADGFTRASEQLVGLGTTLDETGAALATTRGELGQVKADLGRVQQQVDRLARAFEATSLPIGGQDAGGLPILRLAIFSLLLWLAGQAVVSILMGFVLLGRFRERRRLALAARAVSDHG